MDKDKTVEIDKRLKEAIKMAKFIQQCYKDKQSFTIIRKRADGVRRMAFEIARNLN